MEEFVVRFSRVGRLSVKVIVSEDSFYPWNFVEVIVI